MCRSKEVGGEQKEVCSAVMDARPESSRNIPVGVRELELTGPCVLCRQPWAGCQGTTAFMY
jgi:hypothetical protein